MPFIFTHFVGLVWFFTSQLTAMVMSGWSVHQITHFPGQAWPHCIGGNEKTIILSTSVDRKSLKIEFLIGICCPNGDKWQSKTLLLAIFDPRSSIVKSIFDSRHTLACN